MPTKCAPVNHCGTQAPIWIKLDETRVLPARHGDEIEATACVSWMSLRSDDPAEPSPTSGEQDDDALHDVDCCAMKYPVTVRACSGYVVYKLVPTEACNMAYCAHPAVTNGNCIFNSFNLIVRNA